MVIAGRTDARFARVADAFRENFSSRGELGAAVAVYFEGSLVVDLWGGVVDKVTQIPWLENTITVVFSATKGATALCAHVLVSRGAIDLDAPVAKYWPEFAQADKGTIPIRMLLNHQSGLAAITRAFPAEAMCNWKVLIDALAAQQPLWKPGKAHGYHAMTFGWLIGEVVRRVSGKSLGQFFRDEIAGPLELDFWIGLPEQAEQRVAHTRMAAPQPEPAAAARAMRVPSSLTARAFANPPGLLRASQVNSRAIHAAEIPAANGICTARGLARMYSALACRDSATGPLLVNEAQLQSMSAVESKGNDLVLLIPTRFSSGFMKTVDNRPGDSVMMGPNAETFGHVGAGGSIGMADPIAGVAIGYVMNQLGTGVLLNPRGQSLIDAVYDCL